MTISIEVELVLDAHAQLGEGPVWDGMTNVLMWVDIVGCVVHRFDPSVGCDRVVNVGKPVGAVAPRQSGGLVLALEDGFGLLDANCSEPSMIWNTDASERGCRMNDGKCDSAGRFWAGTMAYDLRPYAGALYRLETGYRVTKVLDGITISNGLGWSPDDRRMYFIDSGTGGVDVFDYDRDSGSVSRRRRLVEVSASVGMPDGMTVDSEGFIWVSLWGGSAVHRHAPDGRLDMIISLPVSQVTSCAFGGSDLSDLYITSATAGLSPDQRSRQSLAGGLFRCRPGVTGLAPHFFAG